MPPTPPNSIDERQFEALLQSVSPLAYNVAFRLLGSREEAEDVVQNAAIRAWRSLATFEPGTHFKAWFLKIVVNLALNAQRNATRRPATVNLDETEENPNYLYTQTRATGWHDKSQEPARALMARLDAEHIQEALSKLPPEFRAVAVLHFVEELSYEEIAGVVGCPIGTVRSRLHRARRLLQRELWEMACEMGIAPREAKAKTKSSLLSLGFFFLLGTFLLLQGF
jgi:RNA polymerase sigma-70 factor (ECF subfamily)